MVPMLVIGLQGSPKKNGSSDYLLKRFLGEVEKMGVEVQMLDVPRMNIRPCIGCGHCEKKGFCVIDDDDMLASVYPLLRKAQVVVAASPVFFYSVTSQLKALIDRTQTFWSRKYRFRLSDPLSTTRKGFFLSMGGSRGKKLFDGIHLVAAYFFDAIDAEVSGSLTYPGIETAADFQKMPDLNLEVSKTAHALMSSLLERKRILFLGKNNDIRIQMAGALTQFHAGSRFHVVTSGNDPVREIHPGVVDAMAEIGIDMAFFQPQSPSNTIQEYRPDIIVTMGNHIEIPAIPNVTTSVWNLPDPRNASSELIVQLREQIRENVTRMTTDR
jgi:multimeric flavodoxin WrbA/protein-tyrosine-phosphatase